METLLLLFLLLFGNFIDNIGIIMSAAAAVWLAFGVLK